MRVVLVDFNHMAYSYYFSQHRLSVPVVQDGEVVQKDTTVQNSAIKNIHKWSNYGKFPIAVCFDRPVIARKTWFLDHFPEMREEGKGYKGGRAAMSEQMYDAIGDCERLLTMAGATCLAQKGYEADDLIFAAIKRAKEQYPGVPIDVITNDADLLPVVDDIVSVFIRSKKGTYAVDKSLEKNHYIQVTPDNYQQVIEDLSAYKGYCVPYNTILFHKLVRGDISDGINCIKRKFSPKKYNAIIERMTEDGVDFTSVFRYGDPVVKIEYRDTGEEFKGTLQEALKSPDKGRLHKKVYNTKELDEILRLMDKYTDGDEEVLTHVHDAYWGMNLNQVYPHKERTLARKSFVVENIGRLDEIALQQAVSPLKIRLKGLY